MPPQLFFSYAHRDESLRDELAKHLAVMKRNGEISGWYDRDINAGQEIDAAICAALEGSQIILCLVSPDFLDSRYCYEREMSRALERRRAGDCEVIPVILRTCDWLATPLAALRATPRDGKPITSFADRDAAFFNVATDIRRVARDVMKPLTQPVPREPSSTSEPEERRVGEAAKTGRRRVRRTFKDVDRDAFVESAFGEITRLFEVSLREIQEANPHLQGRFQHIDARSFSVAIYEDGSRVAVGSVWHGADGLANGIYLANSPHVTRGSYNEMLSVADDGFDMFLKPLGFGMMREMKEKLSPTEAGQYLWELVTRSLRA